MIPCKHPTEDYSYIGHVVLPTTVGDTHCPMLRCEGCLRKYFYSINSGMFDLERTILKTEWIHHFPMLLDKGETL